MTDNRNMPCPLCGAAHFRSGFAAGRKGLRGLSRAAAKYAGARLRTAGQLPVFPDWRRRVEICRTCPLRVVADGISYCGRPLGQRFFGKSDQPDGGCGCPVADKARDPAEHCPLTSETGGGECGCRWCVGRMGEVRPLGLPTNAIIGRTGLAV